MSEQSRQDTNLPRKTKPANFEKDTDVSCRTNYFSFAPLTHIKSATTLSTTTIPMSPESNNSSIRSSPRAQSRRNSLLAIVPVSAKASFATLESLLDRGEVYTATCSRDEAVELGVFCCTCRAGRCASCHGSVYEEVVEKGKTLTAVDEEIKICTPCVHGLCSGGRLRLVVAE